MGNPSQEMDPVRKPRISGKARPHRVQQGGIGVAAPQVGIWQLGQGQVQGVEHNHRIFIFVEAPHPE